MFNLSFFLFLRIVNTFGFSRTVFLSVFSVLQPRSPCYLFVTKNYFPFVGTNYFVVFNDIDIVIFVAQTWFKFAYKENRQSLLFQDMRNKSLRSKLIFLKQDCINTFQKPYKVTKFWPREQCVFANSFVVSVNAKCNERDLCQCGFC